MSDDVRAAARRLLEGITPGKWTSRERDWYENTSDCPEDVEIILGDDPYANPYSEIAEVKTQDWDAEDDVEMWANAEFIAAAPALVQGLLNELDRVEREALDANTSNRTLAEDLVGQASAERDAANATLARIQAVAAAVDQDGGHSGPTLARTILSIIGGEA